MSILSKIKKGIKIFRENGFYTVILILTTKYRLPIPLSTKTKRRIGIKSELLFWDSYFRTKGLQWANDYGQRFNPKLILQPRPAALISQKQKSMVLDVGAGPLTYLGKIYEGKIFNIIAVDPLAEEYDRILDKYQIQPLVRTEKLAAEDLENRFQENTFDLVFARNCIDHAYDPEKAILQMIKVAKCGRYVLLEHRQNEAENENYSGLHQWNFSSSDGGDFIISSRFSTVNVTKKYEEICTIELETVHEGEDGDWLITRIYKK